MSVYIDNHGLFLDFKNFVTPYGNCFGEVFISNNGAPSRAAWQRREINKLGSSTIRCSLCFKKNRYERSGKMANDLWNATLSYAKTS